MTMHLEGPWLSMTGKLKSKRRRYASAEAARNARELEQEWQKKMAEWNRLSPRFSAGLDKTVKTVVKGPVVNTRAPVFDPSRDVRKYPSRDTGSGVAALAAPKVYTGTKVKGIGTLHKSNAVPVFSDEEAIEIARMRR